jgi:hypothetical protein
LLGGLLLGQSDGGLVSLGNSDLLFGDVELDVTVAGEVGGNATVGTVSTTATLNGTLDNDVSDDALVGIETLGLSVNLSVEEEIFNSLAGLFGPSTGVGLEFLALGVSATVILEVGNNLLVLKDVLHVLNSFLDEHTLNSAGGVVSVLEMSAQVVDLGFSGYKKNEIIGVFVHLVGSAGCLEYLTIANLYLFINNKTNLAIE